MTNNDPKGYYRTLGVSTSAQTAKIKAAYRSLSKELHPDLNRGRDTTSAFQALQEAYEILGDDRKRAEYDAYGSVPPSEGVQQGHTRHHIDAIRCSSCGCITAQPRFKIFYFVVGYLVGAYREPQKGIFCSKCEFKTSIKATLGTIFLGWWSIPGFIWTIHALLYNLIGGKFYAQNALLQGQQAFYFAQEGNFDLAGATARGALDLIKKAQKEIPLLKSSGSKEGIVGLKNSLENLIESLPQGFSRKNLNNIDGLFNKRFVIQFVAIGFFASLAGYSVRLSNIEQEKVERDREEREANRLKSEGIAAAQAVAIAAQRAAELRYLQKPLPHSGVYHSKFGVPKGNWPPLKVENEPGANALIKFVRVNDGVEVISAFVRSGDTVELRVPPGSYRGKIASGQTWYGDKIRFGPDTGYSEFESTFDFLVEGNELVGKELTLRQMTNGNLRKHAIDANKF